MRLVFCLWWKKVEKLRIKVAWLPLFTYKKACPKCSANPISVTPIWKWYFENKEHHIRGLYRTFFKRLLFKLPFSHKRFQMGQKMYFYQLYIQAVTKVLKKCRILHLSIETHCEAPEGPLPLGTYLIFNLECPSFIIL